MSGKPRHGFSGTPTYRAWTAMLDRCDNKKSTYYKDYGACGINVCERWRSFENFLADMGVVPHGHTLERVDNDKGYGPDNCRWATRAEQGLNRRTNVRLTHNGLTLTLTEWAERLGINRATLYTRRFKGWPTERILQK